MQTVHRYQLHRNCFVRRICVVSSGNTHFGSHFYPHNACRAARALQRPSNPSKPDVRLPRHKSQARRCQALFGVGRKSSNSRQSEQSALVNEELILFIFQLELDSSLQRAFNNQAYETAQQIREKRREIDEYIDMLRKQKLKTTDGAGEGEVSALDLAAEGIRLKSEMQRAVEEERYADAAKFRDLLAEVDRRSKKAQALAGEWNVKLQPVLRLGQRVTHKTWGWRGVIAGWDTRCCETDEWVADTGAKELSRGLEQPYYHVVVDMRDWEDVDEAQPPCAYVAEELLTAPELLDGRSWSQAHGEDPLQHPYCLPLFLGQDGQGDLLPCRQLRSKYNVARRDVYKPDDPPKDEDDKR